MTGASLPLALPQELLNSILQQIKPQSQSLQAKAQYISGATPPSQDSKKLKADLNQLELMN